MIDIHSHLIYGVDDGSRSIEESTEILKGLSENGITDIVLTPHYIVDTRYVSKKTDNIKIFRELQKNIKKENININIYLGNEIYIDRDILNYISNNEMCTLNNSEYALVELPMSGNYPDYIDIFNNMISEGCKVILAHPERYTSIQKDYNKLLELEEMGVLFQCNIGSIIGEYGRDAKKVFKRMLKEHKIAFLGTDIHHVKEEYSYINKAIKKMLKYVNYEELDLILNQNAKSIIEK